MNNNFTPLTTNLRSVNQFKVDSIKKIINGVISIVRIAFNFISGGIIFLVGVFLIATSIYGMREVFGIIDTFLYHASYSTSRDIQTQINVFKYLFTGLSGIVAGNILLISGIKFIFHKKNSFKLLLLGLLILLLNFILSVVLYVLFKFR